MIDQHNEIPGLSGNNDDERMFYAAMNAFEGIAYAVGKCAEHLPASDKLNRQNALLQRIGNELIAHIHAEFPDMVKSK